MLLITIMNVLSIVRRNLFTMCFLESNVYRESIRGENGNHCINVGNWSFQGISKVVSQETRLHGWLSRGFARTVRWGWGQGVCTKETRRLMASSLESKKNWRYEQVEANEKENQWGDRTEVWSGSSQTFSFCILHLLNIEGGAKNTSCMGVDARKIKWAYRKDPDVGF